MTRLESLKARQQQLVGKMGEARDLQDYLQQNPVADAEQYLAERIEVITRQWQEVEASIRDEMGVRAA